MTLTRLDALLLIGCDGRSYQTLTIKYIHHDAPWQAHQETVNTTGECFRYQYNLYSWLSDWVAVRLRPGHSHLGNYRSDLSVLNTPIGLPLPGLEPTVLTLPLTMMMAAAIGLTSSQWISKLHQFLMTNYKSTGWEPHAVQHSYDQRIIQNSGSCMEHQAETLSPSQTSMM